MTTTIAPADGLLLRGAMYELLALGYAYPDPPALARLRNLSARLEPLAAAFHPEWPQRIQQLCAELDGAGLEADFNALFSGAMLAAPFESAYEPDIFRKQHALADVAGFFKAFGFEVPAGSRWQPDHVGTELEFCAIVLQRQARALQQGWDERADICADALRKFLSDHLGRWSAAFAADMTQAASAPFYRNLAELTRSWVEFELVAQGLEPDRLKARQVYPDDATTPVCGGCTGCGPDGPPIGGFDPGGLAGGLGPSGPGGPGGLDGPSDAWRPDGVPTGCPKTPPATS